MGSGASNLYQDAGRRRALLLPLDGIAINAATEFRLRSNCTPNSTGQTYLPPCPECQDVSAHHAQEACRFDSDRVSLQAGREDFAPSNQEEPDQTEDDSQAAVVPPIGTSQAGSGDSGKQNDERRPKW